MSVVAMAVQFEGRYKLENSENFNEFLKEIGMGYFKRLAATASNSEYVVTKEPNDHWKLKTISTFKDSEITFKSGVPFKEDRADGQTVDTTITVDGNRWKQLQRGEPQVNVEREFSDDGVVVRSTANGVTSVRTYKRQK